MNVEFDALRERDQGRRMLRLTVAAAALAVVAATLLALAVTATLSRNEAHRQAEIARRTNGFLRELLTSADPTAARGREVSVREWSTAAEPRSRPTRLARPAAGARRPPDHLGESLHDPGAVSVGGPPARRRGAGRPVRHTHCGDPAQSEHNDRQQRRALRPVAAACTLLLLDHAFAKRGRRDDDAADRSLAEALGMPAPNSPPI